MTQDEPYCLQLRTLNSTGGVSGGLLDVEAGDGDPSAEHDEQHQRSEERYEGDEFERRRPGLVHGPCAC